MFSEQPAPSQPIVQVQPQQVDVAAVRLASTVLTQPNLAPPESLPSISLSSSALPPSAPAVNPAPPQPVPAVNPAPVSATVTPSEAAKAQQRQEVEQALLRITSQARAQKQAQEAQEAAQESAKYGESGDYEKARQAINKPLLPAQIRAALLRKLGAKQVAKTGKLPAGAIAKNTRINQPAPGSSQPPSSSSFSGVSSGYTPPPIGYSTQALIPSNQAALQLPISQLLGKTGLNLILPLTIPAAITSAFGWRTHPITGEARFHRGIDLGAAYGSPIVAAKSGRIYLADMYGGYGLTVIVQHNPMQQTLYAHMSQLFVKPGEWVRQGQLIGQVGSTGASTGPHLHFEFLQQTAQGWSALDPAEIFQQAIAMAQIQNTQRNPKGLGNSLNLSASGVVDISAAAPPLAPQLGEDFISRLIQPAATDSIGLLLPFTVLPQAAVPELGWLSPFVSDLIAVQFDPLSPLPVISESPQSFGFQAIAALIDLPKTTPTPSATAFEAGKLQVATTTPLANLTIAARMPGIVQLQALHQLEAKRPSTLQSSALKETAPSVAGKQTRSPLKTMKLSDNGVPILPSKLPLSVRNP
ncbi:MAG: M23 family metallopeptidase [Leptolyngbyaceae cyanobacterium CAN_BIN12]|nr:M23 family metallopeptidase [Leptolyngbyaceae cyanobacterium CAN_BIN12]